jgi:hypothetical protein
MVFNFFCYTLDFIFEVKVETRLMRKACHQTMYSRAFLSKFTRNTLFCLPILTKDTPHFFVKLQEVSQCENAATYLISG